MADEDKKDDKDKEEQDLFQGDTVRLIPSQSEVSRLLGELNLKWDSAMAPFLGRTGVIQKFEFKEGKQFVYVQFGTDGPCHVHNAQALELVEEEPSNPSDDEGPREDAEEADEHHQGPPHVFRHNEKVRDENRAKRGKVATGIITKMTDNKCDLKYDDNTTKEGVDKDLLRPVEKVNRDGTGFTSTSGYNEFDFTKNQLPSGVEYVGEGVEICPGRGSETCLSVRKATFLKLPLRGMRHDKLRADDPIPSYTLTMELQLSDTHKLLAHPWCLFQTSYPEVHETEEVCIVAKRTPDFPKWKVGTDVDKLVVSTDVEPSSKLLAELPTGTIVQQCGEVQRLENGVRRVPVKFPRKREGEDEQKKEEQKSRKKENDPLSDLFSGGSGLFGGFGGFQEEAARMGTGRMDLDQDEMEIEVYAGYWGSSSGAAPTAFKVASNGISKIVSFQPGVTGGRATVEGMFAEDIGWTPVTHQLHIVSLTLRAVGNHTLTILDGQDPTKTWKNNFWVEGWWDDIYGAAGVRITADPDEQELQLGSETKYQADGEHRLKLVREGSLAVETDELDPKGWVNFNRASLEPLEPWRKDKKGPSCHLKVKDTISKERLVPGRWHSVTITVSELKDELCLYIDGQMACEPIDISFGMRSKGRSGRRAGGMADELTSMAGGVYGPMLGGGYMPMGFAEPQPYAVPQEGFLLFASTSTRSMPGGVKVRKVLFRNLCLEPKVVEDHYVNSRHRRRPAVVTPELSLTPILKKKAYPLWYHAAFIGEFCDPFVQGVDGSPMEMLSVFNLVIQGVMDTILGATDSAWSKEEVEGCRRVQNMFRSAEQIYKKWQPYFFSMAQESETQAALGASYLKRLAQARAELQTGSRLLIPLAQISTSGAQHIMLILEKKAGNTYRFVVVNSSRLSLPHHAASAAQPPKVKFRAALQLDNIPAERAEDEAWWAMLIVTSIHNHDDGSTLYDKLLPWLAGAPLEHVLFEQEAALGPDDDGSAANSVHEWRTPQLGGTDGWRVFTFTLRFLLRDLGGLCRSRAKFFKTQVRQHFVSMCMKDLAKVPSLSISGRRLIRMSLAQHALSTVKVSGLTDYNSDSMVGMLQKTHDFIENVDKAIDRKPEPSGFGDAKVLPILDLKANAEEATAQDWGLHPFFERLLREARSPGQKVGVPLLVPIDLLAMPERIRDLEEAVNALCLCEELCGKLSFVGKERCKFSPFLKVALLEHVFTQLLPLPIGPMAQRAPLSLHDAVWAPTGWDGVHPQMTRALQVEILQILRRLCEHFCASVSSIRSSQGFDGVKIVVLGAIAAVADRVLRTRVRRIVGLEAEPRASKVTELINGHGPKKDWRPLAVDPVSFLKQSETIEVATPQLNITRTAVASYFSEVIEALGIEAGKDETLFDWDLHGWLCFCEKEKGLRRLVQAVCASHLLESDWKSLVAGNPDMYLVHCWPEFACFRDIIYWWKYFLCTDLRVFPAVNDYSPQQAYLKWSVKDESEAFSLPPNRGKVFAVVALGKETNLTAHSEPNHRPKPPASGHRWPSAALPSLYTKTPVRTEDDLLYMRSLPNFEEALRVADAEALLSFLTVPYIRMPLTLAFFTTGDRVNSLFGEQLQKILHAVVLEPGRLLEPKRWGDVPGTVPATTIQESELIATPYGQLLTELACAPACLCAYVAKLVELTLMLANSAMSQTVKLILFVTRIAVRVESSIMLLLQHADGKLVSGGPRPASLPISPAALEELRAGRRRLRELFGEIDEWLDRWLEELGELAQKAMQHAQQEMEDSGGYASDWKHARESAQSKIDDYMALSCNMYAHIVLLLRNVGDDELDSRAVSRFLSSFAFLSLHHTFNDQKMDMPEPELFEVYHQKRRAIVRWFERQQRERQYMRFNSVLREVHRQFATIDSSNSVDTATFEWGAIGGDEHNAGRYCVVGQKRSEAERGDITIISSEEAAWVELNIQLMQVTVRGRHVTPLETETCQNSVFQQVLRLGTGRQSETMQCAALLSTNVVRVRELLSQPFRVTVWNAQAANILPYQGDFVRLYDIEDMEEWESWIPTLFEPVRMQFFVPPVVKKTILFFMREDVDPDASVVMLVGVHPGIRGRVWKEVLVFKDLRMVQIFEIYGYGSQLYRSLEYTTDARYTLATMQPLTDDRRKPWPDWGRYEAGKPSLEPEEHEESVVLTRIIVRDGQGDGCCGAGSRRSDPLDDEAQWSDGEPSDDETAQEKEERTVWERSQREGEQYLPPGCLGGLLPDAILFDYNIYQENEPPWRVLRGYKLTSEGEEEEDPDHILEVKLVKVSKVPCSHTRGWCAVVRKRFKNTRQKPRYLLNLMCAREGTPLYSLARTLVRLEDLSYVLVWTEDDPHQETRDPKISLVELPRVFLSFTVKEEADGSRRLWSLDHADLSVPIGPHTASRTQAAALLLPIPHSLLLETRNQELFAIVPNVKPHRPHIGADPFSTELVLERGNEEWQSVSKNKSFLYPVHASNSFLLASTRASALYLMLLRWMNRDYDSVSSLVSAVGTDTKYEDNEMMMFKHFQSVANDPHPDSHANCLQVSLAVADAGMALPWLVLDEATEYVKRLGHVSARCRLSVTEEFRLLELCEQTRRMIEIVTDEVQVLRRRLWGMWGAAKLKRYQELLSDAKEEMKATEQEFREIEGWLRVMVKKFRAARLPGGKDDVKYWAIRVLQEYSIPEEVALTLSNRNTYLDRLEGRQTEEGDAGGLDAPLMLECPSRPVQTLWQCHTDQNFLLCSLFDFLWEILGAEGVMKGRDVEEEEGPEIPQMRKYSFEMALDLTIKACMGKITMQDFRAAPGIFAMFYSFFTRSTGVRLGRVRETNPVHQHTFAVLLLNIMPSGRYHGVLSSLLHILAQNPSVCESMPLLTKPKKVRTVGQWRQKIQDMYQTVMTAANGLQLANPPGDEDYQSLPSPLMTQVQPEWLVMPPDFKGLCPRLVHCPEVPRFGAAIVSCPNLSTLNCSRRVLRSSSTLSSEEMKMLASKPLGAICAEYLEEVQPVRTMDDKMPFDLNNHPLSKHRVAVSMFGRLETEMKNCARMRNASRRPVLSKLRDEHVRSIVEGDTAALDAAREQIGRLFRRLDELKKADVQFVSDTVSVSQTFANNLDLSATLSADLRHRLRFWLLRFAGLETHLWFEHICSGLLSPNCPSDFQRVNPFLEHAKTEELLDRVMHMMLIAVRVIHLCRCLDSCHDLQVLLAAPEYSGSKIALEAGIKEKAQELCSLLSAKRNYIEFTGDGEASFDPRFLIFEFVTGFLLRPRQVEMVGEFLRTIQEGRSTVRQMIMGAGKTSVVSPVLALMLADGSKLVCLVVPHALITLSRSVLQNAFSTVVMKRISTFRCDRSIDIEVNLSQRIQRTRDRGDVMLSTPLDIKSLQLRFLEQLDLANDRRARRGAGPSGAQMRRECVDMGRMLLLLKEGVCMIDEVDLVLHPLKSELNFPIGNKTLIDHAPERWRVALHLLDGFFSVDKDRVPAHLKDSLGAQQILDRLRATIRSGSERNYLLRTPHLVLLNEDFYHEEVKPIMCDWLGVWLASEHVGRIFEGASVTGDRGLTDEEVKAYCLHRVYRIQHEIEAPLAAWLDHIAFEGEHTWLQNILEGPQDAEPVTGRINFFKAGLTAHVIPQSEYTVRREVPQGEGMVRLHLKETAEGAQTRSNRVDRLSPKDMKSMNLSYDWLQVYLPFVLRKIDRVTFGIMSAEQVAAALAEQPLMPPTRAALAIPFVGKDVPSQSSEFAHPDIVIGLTVLAYRYEGLRQADFEVVLGKLTEMLESENGAIMERPTSMLWKNWVEEAGAIFCVKQQELDNQTAADVLAGSDNTDRMDKQKARVLPLHLLERRNESNMMQLFHLMRRLPSAVHFYLETNIFPEFMRFQDEKLSASGQDLGGSILFGQRIGFSGTPSDLMPRELGECGYEPGSEGEMMSTMTDPGVVSFEAIGGGWNVESLLDRIIAAAHAGSCNALIDTGALITGFTNREVAEYLLGFGKARRGDAAKAASLPESVDGVVFLEEDGAKKILVRQTREATKLADSGVPVQKRFAFYDQVHTTGMDIKHKLDAVAALTLGKDMNWRDYVQGAYRMRGIGRGQRICLYVIPEVAELITKDIQLAGIQDELHAGMGDWAESEMGRLLAVAAWLLVNSIRTERVQFSMLQVQNLANVWRKNAFKQIMSNFEILTHDDLRKAVKMFKEAMAFALPDRVPRLRSMQDVVEELIEKSKAYIIEEEDNITVVEVKENVTMVAQLGNADKDGEAALETQQQQEKQQERQQEQEQEEEREQEIEIEKFVDLMHCRDEESPSSWELVTLKAEGTATQFYPTAQFRLWKRKPMSKLPPEAQLSRNWFNPQWSGFRRVKNVFLQMEWTPDILKAVRSTTDLELDTEEEAEMHRKLRLIWDLLTRGVGSGEASLTQAASAEPVAEETEEEGALAVPAGSIGADQIQELLGAAFDWEPALHDAVAALAILGKRKDEVIDYTSMATLLREARFRTRDDRRHFVLLSLAEGETLRRILHGKIGRPLIDGAPNTTVALRCVFANNEVLDASFGFQAGPPFQVNMIHQLARFLDGQTFYRQPELSVLLRAVQRDRPFDRRRFFEALGGCRRRAGVAAWDSHPVAEVLRPWLEFEQVLARVRAVRLRLAIVGREFSVEEAFRRYDVDNSGLLEPMEFCRALHDLGFAFDAGEVANWIEAMDTNEDYCIDYPEFFNFCKVQVDMLLGPMMQAKARDVVESATKRHRAVQMAPKLARHTSEIVKPGAIEDELAQRRAAIKQAEAIESRAKAEEEDKIEVLIEEELGTNPCYGDGYGEWDFRGMLLPKDTFALGVVDIVPESWGTGKGSNYLQLDMRAGLAVQHLQLTPNGDSDRFLNRYCLTVWFRTPILPSKADRMLLLDVPRGEADPEAYDEGKTGALWIWRGGVIAPEGYNEPALRRHASGATSGVEAVTGDWQLTVSEEGKDDQYIEVKMVVQPSGRLTVRPLRGTAARRQEGGPRIFGVRMKMKEEKDAYIDTRFGGVVPSNFRRVFNHFWFSYITSLYDVLLQNYQRSWSELGYPRGEEQCKEFNKKLFRETGDMLLARNLDATAAVRLARDLTVRVVSFLKNASAEMVEDHTFEQMIRVGDKVRRSKEADGVVHLEGEEVGTVTSERQFYEWDPRPVLVRSEKGQDRWLREADLVKVSLKQLGLEPLTDSEWMLMPSTRSNYVSFVQKLPNPFFEAAWSAQGRAESSSKSAVEASLSFDADVSNNRLMPAYVDAKVAYADGGRLQVEGTWKASDGSTGSIVGTKALAGMSLSGLWHVELQSGADSMEHAWNCWFSYFPGSESGSIRISGMVLAGPMLDEEHAVTMPIAGEMTGKGAMRFTLQGTEGLGGHWAGSTWECELGPDRWLRGSWQLDSNSSSEKRTGRWRARHIGRKAVHNTLRPVLQEGVEWSVRDCTVSANVGNKSRRLKVGCKVKLTKNWKDFMDPDDDLPLKKPGQIGELIEDDMDPDRPYLVRHGDVDGWYHLLSIKEVKEDVNDEVGLPNPFGDEFDGLTFQRFPLEQGSWYAEVHVERLSKKTMAMVGWGVLGEDGGFQSLLRVAVIDGKGSRKLDTKDVEVQEKPKTEEGEGEEEKKEEGDEEKRDKDEEDKEKDEAKGDEEKKKEEGEEEKEKEKKDGEEDGEEEEDENEEDGDGNEEEKQPEKGIEMWKKAVPYGHQWQAGDVICCAATMPGGKITFGLNGDFRAPMGEAFDLELPEGSRLCLLCAAGEDGRLRVNLGQVAFSNPPPTAEHRGLGEAMRIRPTWQVTLPKEVKGWPVYAEPSRSGDVKDSRKALKNEDLVEQIKVSEDGWLQHESGWSMIKRTVAGQEYEALRLTPPWHSIDRPEPPKRKKKVLKRVVNASFDIERGSQNNWNFRGIDTAVNTNGPKMLLSNESVASGILKWCVKIEEGNEAFEVGVVPASKAEDPAYLHSTGEIGLKSSNTTGAEQLEAWDMYKQFIEVIVDMTDMKAKFRVGSERESLVDVKVCDVPYEEDVRLAITGNAGFTCQLQEPSIERSGDESSDDGEEDDYEGPIVTTCGNAVQANSWHVVSISVDLLHSTMKVVLDGEPHLEVRDPVGLVPDGPFAISPSSGLMLFSSTRRTAGILLGGEDWRIGGHLRWLRLDSAALDQFAVWSQQISKGVWICRCSARNSADARVCWKCRQARQKTGPRPPNDADPRHPGLTIVTAESFRELVLDSTSHVFIMASAAWCGACKQLKPLWTRLAELLAADTDITVATIDIDENELPNKYFPEKFIPVVKLFVKEKKRQPVTFQLFGNVSLDDLGAFIEQHTNVNIRAAIELGYPAYCERLGVNTLLEGLKTAATEMCLPRAIGRTGLQTLAAFLYAHLLDPAHAPADEPPPAAPLLSRMVSGDAAWRRTPSAAQDAAEDAIGQLQSIVPGSMSLPAAPVLLRSSSSPARPLPPTLQRAFTPGPLDAKLMERLCEELLVKRLTAELRTSQPEDPAGFALSFFLKEAKPAYNPRTFFNSRTGQSWKMAPAATYFVAAAKILRFLMRCVKSVGIGYTAPGAQRAPPNVTDMTAVALRHNWRRMESAIAAEEQQHNLCEVQLLLERGFVVNSSPFGTTPLILAAAVGNLPAAQFLFVHGANPHIQGGRPQALPLEVAARFGNMKVVELLAENGSVLGRGLHFAAAAGAVDVTRYLLSKSASPELRIGGLSPVAIALITGQHRLASILLPRCRPKHLVQAIPEVGCHAVGLADGSTLLHLAASLGALRENFIVELSDTHYELAGVENSLGQTPFELMTPTLKAVTQPKYYGAFDACGPTATDRATMVKAALEKGASEAALDVNFFSLLDLASFAGDKELAEVLLAKKAPVASRGPPKPSALMWAHWRNNQDVVVLLCSNGASLTNADLEGLTRLRHAWTELETPKEQEEVETARASSSAWDKKRTKKPSASGAAAQAAASPKGEKALEETIVMRPDLASIWTSCAPIAGYLSAVQGLLKRMAWGVGITIGAAGQSFDEVQPDTASEFLKAALAACTDAARVERAKLTGLRHVAEGGAMSIADTMALQLFVSDPGFHEVCCRSWLAMGSHQPPVAEAERAHEYRAAHAQLVRGLQSIPAKKGICFRALRVDLPDGELRRLLCGHTTSFDVYRPGSLVLWRHPASATTDPCLAEEVALRGEPGSGCGIIFKIRRAISARCIGGFSEYPDQHEVVFPPCSVFRVAGFLPCTEQCIRRGVATHSGPWEVDVGFTQRAEALSWESACRSQTLVVLLDEEDEQALHWEMMPP